jgi:hypothetical protein
MIVSLTKLDDIRTLEDVREILKSAIWFYQHTGDASHAEYWDTQYEWWQHRIEHHDYTKDDECRTWVDAALRRANNPIL